VSCAAPAKLEVDSRILKRTALGAWIFWWGGWVVSGWALAQDPPVLASFPDAVVQLDAGTAPLASQSEESEEEGSDVVVPHRLVTPPIAKAQPLPAELDLVARARKFADGRYAVTRDGGEEALTLVPALQSQLNGILRSYQTPYAAVVVMEPGTGRVLAMAEHSEKDPKLTGLTTKAVFPAASIFKIVTASALLETGMEPTDTECAWGAKRKISERNISADGGVCRTLSEALAKSANSIFAKLTVKRLSPATLGDRARAFYFNRAIPFPVPTDVSLAAFPEDELGLASTGAGFGDVYLSPLHAAALAGTVANGGVWPQPVLFESDAAHRVANERVMSAAEASKLADMMEETVTDGTARRYFRERGHQVRGAAGKTGSLADKRPFRDYSWFVGFAPRDKPQVAVGAVIVNEPLWRIRGTWLGREAMRLALEHVSPEPSAAR
jgi:peptidoglycan glycosyltransferase